MNRIFLAIVSCLVLSGCISYGPQNEPSYPFQVVFYEDGTCDITASILKGVQYTGWETEAGVLNDSNWWNFADIECSDGYYKFEFKLFKKRQFAPSMVPGRYIRSDQDLLFNLSARIDNTDPSGDDYHPILQDQYTATATTNIFDIPLRSYKILSCGSKVYSKNGTATIYSVENTAKTGIYAEINGRLIAGGKSCF